MLTQRQDLILPFLLAVPPRRANGYHILWYISEPLGISKLWFAKGKTYSLGEPQICWLPQIIRGYDLTNPAKGSLTCGRSPTARNITNDIASYIICQCVNALSK